MNELQNFSKNSECQICIKLFFNAAIKSAQLILIFIEK